MSTSRPTENAPGLVLFPIYEQYAGMIAEELSGLTESQAQWQSANWNWSGWSIRQNISHVASHIFRHYLLSRNWGKLAPKCLLLYPKIVNILSKRNNLGIL